MKALKNSPPRKLPYKGRRNRKYLREDEVLKLRNSAANVGRFRDRDATLILIMYRHGLRIGEALTLTWGQVDLKAKRIYVRRLKNGKPSIQELNDEEARALSHLQNDNCDQFTHVFKSSQGGGLNRSTAYKMIARAGRLAGLDEIVNTHMLRHSCGHHLSNVRKVDTRRIQDYLGHKDIRHTVAYTELDENKFNGLWDD